VLGIIVIAFIAQIVIEKEITSAIIVRSVLPLALCVSAIIKVCTGSGIRMRRSKLYEETYHDELRYAFYSENKKHLHSKLLSAIGLYNHNQFETAIKRLKDLLPYCETDDDYCAVLLFLALSYTDVGLTDSAINTYYEIIHHNQTRSRVWSNLGMLFKQQGKNKDALSCYANALKYDEKNPYAYNNIAGAYFALGEYNISIEYGKRALELKSNIYQASNVVCLSYCALKNPEECEKYYKISVGNGAEPNGLKSAIDRINSGNNAVEDIVPIPDNVKKALSEFYCKTAQPFVSVRLSNDGGRSCLGGACIGVAPFDNNGNPMHLLCALLCSEIHGVPDFPAEGLLQFYIAVDENYGADINNPTKQNNFRVIYSDSENVESSESETPEYDSAFPISENFHLQFVPSVDAMTYSDYRFRAELDDCLKNQGAEVCDDMDENLYESICEMHCGQEHRIGGYPYFCQNDPREEHTELRKYDTLLLQIVSHRHNGKDLIMIGDCGVMNFFIPHEKLQQKDFSDILYWWDCE